MRCRYIRKIFQNEENGYTIAVFSTQDNNVPLSARDKFWSAKKVIAFTAIGYDLPLSDEIEVDFNGLRRICNSFVISLMHKNLVDKFVQHHGVQFFKILIFLDQCDEFIGGFLAAFVFVYCFLQGSSFRFKAFLLLGVLGIQNLLPLVRAVSEGVVLIDFAD